MSPVRRELAFFLPASAVVAADQFSKLWVQSHLAYGESLPPEAPVRLTHIVNPGAVFGLVAPPLLMVVLTLTVIALLLLFYRHPFFDRGWLRPALGMVVGGGLGNLIDRLRLGVVTDFIDLRVWPVFNLGDSAVVMGIVILVYFLGVRKSGGTGSSSPPWSPSPSKERGIERKKPGGHPLEPSPEGR